MTNKHSQYEQNVLASVHMFSGIFFGFLLLLFLYIYFGRGLNSYDIANQMTANTLACPAGYHPVCGVNGKTYNTSCFAKKDGVALLHEGVCALQDAGISQKSSTECLPGSCCAKSLEYIKKMGYIQAGEEGKCPQGFFASAFSCEHSLIWCEPEKKIQEVPKEKIINEKQESQKTILPQKIHDYYQSSYQYGYILPGTVYYSSISPGFGSSHAIAVSIDGSLEETGVELTLYFYPKSSSPSPASYWDNAPGVTFISGDLGTLVAVESTPESATVTKIVQKTFYTGEKKDFSQEK